MTRTRIGRKPRPVGRPPRAGKASDEVVRLRATTSERQAWERAAGALSLSEWIRARLNSASR